MEKFDLTNINTKHIIYFNAVAKYGSMTKAAAVLNVTQPLLSQRIIHLEDVLGVKLFVRENRQLVLTWVGQMLYKKWTKLAKNLEQSIQEVKNAQMEGAKQIKMGFSNSIYSDLVHNLVTRIRDDLSEYIINIKLDNVFRLTDLVLDETLDAVIFSNYNFERSIPELMVTHIAYFPLLVTINKSNPLAQKKNLTWGDLRMENFLITHPTPQGCYEKAISEECLKHGFAPQIDYCSKDEGVATVFMRVSMGEGVMVTLLPGMKHENVVTFAMSGKEYPISLAWKTFSKLGVEDFAFKAGKVIGPIIENCVKSMEG